jgi:pimeloyl-ACP methyl ester carboxylesterase
MTDQTASHESAFHLDSVVARLRPLIPNRIRTALESRFPPLTPALVAERKTLHSHKGEALSYYVEKKVHGRPLVLIHSISACASAYEMKPLFEHFREVRPTYAPDLPGFGFSERGARTYTPELYVDELIELLTRIKDKGDAPDVVAMSLSCEFVARVAATRNDLIHTLTFISPTGLERNGDGHGHSAMRTVTSLGDTSHEPWWAKLAFGAIASRPSIRYFLKKSFVGAVDEGLRDYAYTTSHQRGAEHAPMALLRGSLFTKGIYDTYAKVDRPALVLYDRDGYVSFDRLPELVASSPTWESKRLVPSLGMPQFERLEQTVEALEEFWRSHGHAKHG